MGFNYGLEKKNFDSQWAMTRKQYEDAGMSSEAIQAMHDYDWSVFNANRSYQNHMQEMAAPSFEQSEESYSPLIEVLQTLVVALGAGLGVWGAINLLEGYGNDNPGSNAHVR